ncbi:RHS repeat-associated core domain-containing protein [Pseudomonas abietaniphila]|uniref:RHS repeat-associated core domain-containing protein n=1 Tax=Pseudomonas abietaniphila TaxID=89065 RepID=UPI003217EC3E
MSAETATQTFKYTDDGRLIQSTAADATITLRCYYPQAGGASPDISAFMGSAWKNERKDSAAAPQTFCLKAPKTPAGLKRPIQAEFEYQKFAGQVLPIALTLYGYSTVKGSERAPLKQDTVVIIKGVTLSNLSNASGRGDTVWELKLAEGRTVPEVRCQQLVESSDELVATATAIERRYWGTEKCQLVTTRTQTADPAKGMTTLTLTSRTTDDPRDNIDLSTERRSLYSGRLLHRTEGGQQVRYTYDALGRVTGEMTYTSNPSQNELSERTDKVISDLVTRYEEIASGTRLIVFDRSQPQARRRRIWQDGLQQVIRIEEQREPGEDLSDSNFCPIHDAGRTLDYMPGGLQRVADPVDRPDYVSDWMWTGSKDTYSPLMTDDRAVIQDAQVEHDQTLGNVQGARVTHRSLQVNLPNGGVIQRDYSFMPADNKQNQDDEYDESMIVKHYETEQTLDWRGRLTTLKTHATEGTREFKIQYDDLDRPVLWSGADGTQIERAYHAMGTEVKSLTVMTKEGTKTVVGSQDIDAQSQVSARTVGARAYAFTYDNGRFAGATMPDTTQVFSERSADGNVLSWKGKTAKGDLTTLATFTYDPLQAAIQSRHTVTGADDSQQIVATDQHSPWLDSHQRQVCSDQILSAGFYYSLLGANYVTQYPNDSYVVAWQDRLGRRTRVQRNHLDYRYRYNAFGQCERVTVLDRQTGHTLIVGHEFDGLGQETCRTYWLNGSEFEKYEQQWSLSGQLIKKVVTREGEVCLSEAFEYDVRDRLKTWSVDEKTSNGPADESGKAIRRQVYGYDAINNLTLCETLYADNTTQKQEYTYSTENPTQRIKVVTINGNSAGATSRAESTLVYDANGNLTQDDQGRKLAYTLTGRLASITGKDKTLITRYEYDEQDRLAIQWDVKNSQSRVLVYSGDALCGEIWRNDSGKEIKRIRFDEEAGLAVQIVEGSSLHTVFTLSDPQNGMSSELQPDSASGLNRRSICYTPWGESPNAGQSAMLSGIGYNDARRDPVTGSYHLGNGYRTYSPALRVFQQPDSASPFGRGALNDYAYCSGDPVNLFDPDGHIMISRWGQENMLRSLDKMVSDWTWTPAPEPTPEKNSGFWAIMSSIIWGGVAILTAVAGVLLAIPTGGLSLALAGAALAATAVATGLSIASVALQNSNPELASKLGWAAFGIDMGTMLSGVVKSVVSRGARLIRWAGSKVGRLASKVKDEMTLARGFAGQIAPGKNTSGVVTGAKHGQAKYKIYVGDVDSKRLVVDSHGYFRKESKRFFVPSDTHISFYTPKYKVALTDHSNYSVDVRNKPQFGRNRPNFDPAKANKLIPDYNLAPLENDWYENAGYISKTTANMPTNTPQLKLAKDLQFEAEIDLRYSRFARSTGVDILRLTEGNTTFREVIEKILPNEQIKYKSIEGFFCRGKYLPKESRTAVRLKHALKLDTWFDFDLPTC